MPCQENCSPQPNNEQKPPHASIHPKNERPNSKDTTAQGSKQNETPEEKLDLGLVRWTRAVAVFTAALVIAAGLQFWVMRGQLNEMTATRESTDNSMTDQMAIMREQAKTMQGQLDQISLAQRAWLMVDSMSSSNIQQFPVGAGLVVFANYKITNLGHVPARSVRVKKALFLQGIDKFDENSVQDLCSTEVGETELLLSDYSDLILPGQTEQIEGGGPTNWFAHAVDTIDQNMSLVSAKQMWNLSKEEWLPYQYLP